jgi:hypothetical protein
MSEPRIEQRWTKEGDESWCIIDGAMILGFGGGNEGKKSCEEVIERGDKLSGYNHCSKYILLAPPEAKVNSATGKDGI